MSGASPRTATLLQLLGSTSIRLMVGDPRVKVTGVAYDSRGVEPGEVFVALVGAESDGHRYVPQALERGAAALVVSQQPSASVGVPVLVVDDTRAALAQLATHWFRRPSRALKVVGLTGTNGKTTVTYLLESLIRASGGRAAVMGTTGLRWEGSSTPLVNTTPESLDLQGMLRDLVEAGATHVALEASSHGLATHRLDGVVFAARTFTNLSRDHLDFHGDMESYFAAKRRLFLDFSGGDAIVNADDPYGRRLLAELPDAMSFSLRPDSDATVRPLERPTLSADGVEVRLGTPQGNVFVASPMIGRPNLENLAAAVATGVALGLPAEGLAVGASANVVAPGRLQRIPDPGGRLVVVDYAHTPHALERTLETVRELTDGRVATVFGCGGDRDPGKRSEMGRIGSSGSDLTFVTDDNPRSERPEAIRDAILSGVSEDRRDLVQEVGDRRQAIALALAATGPGDVVLVAGKGHETYQETAGRRWDFDDAAVCVEQLSRVGA